MEAGFLEIVDLVAMVVALVTGKWLKSAAWFNTKFVPIGNLVVVVIVKIGVALGLSVAQAAPLGLIALGWSWHAMLGQVLRVVLDTILPSGVQSVTKNVTQGLQGKDGLFIKKVPVRR